MYAILKSKTIARNISGIKSAIAAIDFIIILNAISRELLCDRVLSLSSAKLTIEL